MILDKPILAVDFDGTLTLGDTRKWKEGVSYNDIMRKRIRLFDFLLLNRERFYLILWTCREGKDIERAVNFCKKEGLIFDKINENIVSFPTGKKVYADYYLDDKSITLKNFQNVLCKQKNGNRCVPQAFPFL